MIASAAVGGCSSSDDGTAEPDDERQEYVDALTEQLDSRFNSPLDLTADELVCFAEEIIDTIGLAPLREAALDPDAVRSGKGITTQGVAMPDDAMVDELSDRISTCADLPAVLAGSYYREQEDRSCFAERVDAALVKRTFVMLLIANYEAVGADAKEEFIDTRTECLEELHGSQPQVTV